MIYSTYYKKNTNEDPKTSIVFENLMLLPDNVFWNILKASAANKGILPEDAGLMADNFYFWPKWNPNSKYDTGNSNYVEPDVFLRFENLDVIIEAKYSDNEGQYREEWVREFKAYLNEFENDKKKVILFAVGGNSTFQQEREIKVGEYKCPIIKYSWHSLLAAVLDFEKEKLLNIENENQSSMKRIIRNIEVGFQNIGIHKYHKKVELKGLCNLYTLGKVFKSATNRETEQYSLSFYKWHLNDSFYGVCFKVNLKEIISIDLWIKDNKELISIGVDRPIEGKKPFSFDYAENPYWDKDDKKSYFDANDEFYQKFGAAETFDAQVDLVSRYIDEVCLSILNIEAGS